MQSSSKSRAKKRKKWCLIKWASQESGRRDDGGGGQAQGRRPGQWQTVFCLRPTKVFAPRRQTDTWKTPAVYDSPGLECRMPTSRICEHLSSITWVSIVSIQTEVRMIGNVKSTRLWWINWFYCAFSEIFPWASYFKVITPNTIRPMEKWTISPYPIEQYMSGNRPDLRRDRWMTFSYQMLFPNTRSIYHPVTLLPKIREVMKI